MINTMIRITRIVVVALVLSVHWRVHPQTAQDTALCALIAATSVQSARSQYSCTVGGAAASSPCQPGSEWLGTQCSGSFVVSLDLNGLALTGTYALCGTYILVVFLCVVCFIVRYCFRYCLY